MKRVSQEYEKYTDSGIEWIGKIPQHWETARIYDIAIQRKIRNIGLSEENLLSLSYGKIKRKDIDSHFGLLPESFETYQIVERGNIILRLTDLQNDQRSLRVGLVTERGIITSAYLCLHLLRKVNPIFAYYLLYSFDISKVFYWFGGGLRQSMKFNDVKVIPFVLPLLTEQKAIAHYLDTKTAQIDRKIDLLTQKAQRYEELKRSLINETVTRGLDKSVPMKDSGIEWIGEIPEHWKSRRLKDICVYTKGYAFKSDQFIDSGTPIVKATDIKQGGIMNPTSFIDPSSSKFYKNVQLRNNDIVISTVGSQPNIIDSAVGQLARINKKIEGALLNQNTVILRIHRADMGNFFFTML